MKVVWVVFENICFALGLFVILFVLTNVINGSKVSLYKDGEQIYCFSGDFKHTCVNMQKEETPHQKSREDFDWWSLLNNLR